MSYLDPVLITSDKPQETLGFHGCYWILWSLLLDTHGYTHGYNHPIELAKNRENPMGNFCKASIGL